MKKKLIFFIVGAPRCGTSSMYNWLKTHPNIFMTTPKEPCYFNSDFGPNNVKTWEEYKELFSGVSDIHNAVGEASTIYAYSKEAIPNILSVFPDARIIFMLRNPIDMVISMHNQELRSYNEDKNDFADAWRSQIKRAKGELIPEKCRDESLLFYYERARLGTQLQRIKESVAENKLMVIFMEDIRNDPRRVYLDVLDFLGLKDDGRREFEATNIYRKYRNNRIRDVAKKIKRILNIQKNTGIMKWNQRIVEKPKLSDDIRSEINSAFEEEIEIIANQTGKDLRHWLNCQDPKSL